MTVCCNDCHETGEAEMRDWLCPLTAKESLTPTCGDCGSDNVTEADQLIDEAEARLTNR